MPSSQEVNHLKGLFFILLQALLLDAINVAFNSLIAWIAWAAIVAPEFKWPFINPLVIFGIILGMRSIFKAVKGM